MGFNLIKIPNKSKFYKIYLKNLEEENDTKIKLISMEQNFNENEIKNYFKIFGKILSVTIEYTNKKYDPANNHAPNVISYNANKIQVINLVYSPNPKVKYLLDKEISNLMMQAYFSDAFNSKQAVLKLNEMDLNQNSSNSSSHPGQMTNNIPFMKDGKQQVQVNNRLMEILDEEVEDAMVDHKEQMKHIPQEAEVDEEGQLEVRDNKTGKVNDGNTVAHVYRHKAIRNRGKIYKDLGDRKMKLHDRNMKFKDKNKRNNMKMK